MSVLVICMAIGPLLVWRSGIMPSARTTLTAACIGASLASLAGLSLVNGLSAAAIAGLGLAGWLGISVIGDLLFRIKPFRPGAPAAA